MKSTFPDASRSPPDAQPTLNGRSTDASQTLKIALDLQKQMNFDFWTPQAEPDMGDPGLPAP